MKQRDEFPVQGIDHIEFWVGNAKQSAHYFSTAFGFHETAYAGLETGTRDRVSHVVEQRTIRFVITGSLGPDSEIARHVQRHGDGVRDIALRVPDAEDAYRVAVSRGAIPVAEPSVSEDDHGKVIRAAIGTYGETIHSLIQREDYSGPFLPGFRAVESKPDEAGLKIIDHVVGNVELGKMNEWADYYARVMGFTNLVHYRDDQISTEYTALMSKVMWDGSGRIKFPINEPAKAKKKSQIDEYLEFYAGPGVQHLALLTNDIVGTVARLRDRGVEFLRVPQTYYGELEARVGKISEPVESLAELGVLVDRDDEGYMLQIFTRPVGDRPTLFFEIIQRRGGRSFGKGNFKALFEAIEREQALRGNL